MAELAQRIRIKYDKEAKTVYIYIKDGEFGHTRELDDSCYVDINLDGSVAGIEILNVEEVKYE